MEVLFGKDNKKKYDTAVTFVTSDKKLGTKGDILDTKTDNIISDTIKNDKKFEGSFGQSKIITLPAKADYSQVLVMGIGDTTELDAQKARDLGGKMSVALNKFFAAKADILVEDFPGFDSALCLYIGEGLARRSYRFNKYFTAERPDQAQSIETALFLHDNGASLTEKYKDIAALIEGITLSKDLLMTRANDLYPESFAQIALEELKPLGVKVKILDDKKLEKMGAGAIMGVGKGSAQKPRMVILEYNGKGKSSTTPDLGMVGKGVTFDTGGTNLKVSWDLAYMYQDMGGSGCVTGAIKTLAMKKAKVHVVGVLCLAENMISDECFRTSDIITSLSGKTIEVLNTDAEGRLVMADGLTYVQNEYKPKTVIDIATLTGGVMTALGFKYAGIFTQNEELWGKINQASETSGDQVWRLPMNNEWDEDMKGENSDLRNIPGTGGFARMGQPSTAAHFLKSFVQEGTTWAHIDIAGTVLNMAAETPLAARGMATGHGVSLLVHLAENI